MSAERRIYYMSRFELTGSLFLSPRREPRRRVSAELKIERWYIGARTTTILFSVYKLTVKGESRNVTVPSRQIIKQLSIIKHAGYFFQFTTSDHSDVMIWKVNKRRGTHILLHAFLILRLTLSQGRRRRKWKLSAFLILRIILDRRPV